MRARALKYSVKPKRTRKKRQDGFTPQELKDQHTRMEMLYKRTDQAVRKEALIKSWRAGLTGNAHNPPPPRGTSALQRTPPSLFAKPVYAALSNTPTQHH